MLMYIGCTIVHHTYPRQIKEGMQNMLREPKRNASFMCASTAVKINVASDYMFPPRLLSSHFPEWKVPNSSVTRSSSIVFITYSSIACFSASHA